ncbi:DNA repair protein RecO [Cryomorpha ignava]|uniref:DNA repair protein RecO n=1 Tax=Cryomorpha ignava TaxID=101383 RepID=A0A7K3WKF8_9FLAO|nr:DNA repair protein RecO [Cryomorpha ignava]NEN22119.1 DNA repair protein RecO [Cryomorpha ignava]
MPGTTEGIVLKKVSYSSSSAIATIYTRKFGQTPFMVRGIGKKGGKSAALQPLTRVEIVCRFREKNQVQSLTGLTVKPGSGFSGHPVKAATSMFLAEFLYKALRVESADEELYDFLDSALEYFADDENSTNFHLILLIKLTRFFGFHPSGKWSEKSNWFDLLNGLYTTDRNSSLHMLEPRLSWFLYEMSLAGFDQKIGELTNTDRRKLLHALVEYYQIHLEGLGEIKSLPVLIEIFS